MNKIVLIQLPSPWLISDRDLPLMGTLHLAASLREANINVQVADLVGLDEQDWHIPEGDVYGISIVSPQVPIAKKVIDLLRSRTKHKVTIIAGGPHASAMPEWCIKHLGVDYAVVGEADYALPSLVLYGSSTPVVVCEPPSLHAIPLPARDAVDIRSFHRIGTNRYVGDVKYEGYIQTGRGCPFNCAFCAQSCITQRNTRTYPLGRVKADVKELLEKYECELIYVEDDTFNINKKRVAELCKMFKSLKFKWHCLCRADLMTQEIADQMSDAGCQNVTFGFESGSDKILKAMNKCETVADAKRAVDIVNNAGMGVRGQMIVGFPGEDDTTIEETKEFVRSTPVSKWGFHAFVPLPGSKSWKMLGLSDDPPIQFFEEGFHTIGKPGEWSKTWSRHTARWLSELRDLAAEMNVF